MPANVAYRVKAVFRPHSDQALLFCFVSDNGKGQVAEAVAARGWIVKSVTGATADDLSELPMFVELDRRIRVAVAEREAQRAKAEKERKERAAAEAVLAEERRVEQARAEEERRAREARARRARAEAAVNAIMGDILQSPPEAAALGVELFSVIRHKVELFLSANMGNQAVYNSICIDCAEFQGRHGQKLPAASRLLTMLTASMGRCYELEAEASQVKANLVLMAERADADIRAISSRSYVYGGSGLFLALSAMEAESNVKRDEEQIDSVVDA